MSPPIGRDSGSGFICDSSSGCICDFGSGCICGCGFGCGCGCVAPGLAMVHVEGIVAAAERWCETPATISLASSSIPFSRLRNVSTYNTYVGCELHMQVVPLEVLVVA